MAKRFRSRFESRVCQALDKRNVKYGYETEVLHYVVPQSNHKYLCDVYLKSSDIYVELKGRFTLEDRKKMINVRNSHPDKDIRIVFMQNNPIRKGSKTKYSDWCDKNGFKYAFGSIPSEWCKKKKGK